MPRLLKLGIYDAGYLAQFYERRPALAGAPYAVQHAKLIGDRAASSDFWTAALARRGYKTLDLVANAAPLQRRWAIENDVDFDPATYLFAVSTAQIGRFKPDVLLVADYSTFTPAFLQDIRAACPSIRLIVGWCGAPYRDLSVMREWDVAMSCIPEMVEDFTAAGLTAHHVNHAFDPRILTEIGPAVDPVAFSFVGSVMIGSGFHLEREALLRELIRSTPLRIWSSVGGARPATGPRAQVRAAVRALIGNRDGPAVRRLPVYSALRRWANPPRSGVGVDARIAARAAPGLYGLDMFRRLRDSALTLNSHINVSPRSASNMRLFEACGVGTCQLTDWKANIATLFEPDREIVTYASAAEAVEKYRYLADRPAERRAIAVAGQRRALRDHNFDRRAEVIDCILRKALGGRR